MIKLLDETCQVVGTFRSPVQLFTHLRENLKNLDDPEREDWRFVTYSHKMLAKILKELKRNPFADMAQEACQQEQNMVVMCVGDADSPFLFLETPDLDMACIWTQWCEHYCKAHNMYIVTQ